MKRRNRPLSALCVGLLVAVAASGEEGPAIRLMNITSESYISGPTVLRAGLRAVRVRAESVRFFANGRLVCTITEPPYDCAWDAGPELRAHQIRVVAELADGTRLVDTVRTKDLGHAESVNVEVVHVPVLVTDTRGRFVRGLLPEAFRIFDEEAVQPISYFASQDQPLEIVLAIDISASMAPVITDLKEAVRRFLQAVRPQDSVMVLAFNERVFTVARREASTAERELAIGRLRAWGGTALHDAILRALDLLKGRAGRKALVIFTDGDDRSSRAGGEQVERALQQSDIVLNSIGLGTGAGSSVFRGRLEEIAKESGGRALFVKRATDLHAAFASIVEELSHYYLLGYVPPEGRREGWRRIRVDVPGARHKVRARDGYVVQRPGGGS